jgi:hypothetical protein
MADKRREAWYVQRLRGALARFPDGTILPGESPDFVVKTKHHAVGIEVTRFYLPPIEGERPQQEQQSLKDRVVHTAHQMHMNLGGPALYVSVHFRTPLSIAKRDVLGMARQLATAVLQTPAPNSIDEPSVSVAWDVLPPFIATIRISGSVDGQDRLWYADAGGWVAPVGAHHITDVIERKTAMSRIAREKCDELWLLIVNDEFSRAAPTRLTENAAEHRYSPVFDRLLWLEPHAQKVFKLKGRG